MKNQEKLLTPKARLDRLRQSIASEKNKPVKTGFSELDDLLCGGFHPGNVYMIGSRPGVGKTALALSMAKNMQNNVLFASAEMGSDQLEERLMLYGTDLKKSKIFACSTCITSISDIKEMALQTPCLCAIFVDYLELFIDCPEIAWDAVRQLKILSLELNVPVIVTFQLPPSVDDRPDGVPTPDDFPYDFETESIATAVMYLYSTGIFGDPITLPQMKLFVDGFDIVNTGTVNLLFCPQCRMFVS